jgi:hypothetical protein
MTFQKLQMPSITRFRLEVLTRLCTVYVGLTANFAGITPVVSRYVIDRDASSSGTA